MHSLPAGWLIPIAIFFVISFPPVSLSLTCSFVVGLGAALGIVYRGYRATRYPLPIARAWASMCGPYPSLLFFARLRRPLRNLSSQPRTLHYTKIDVDLQGFAPDGPVLPMSTLMGL